MRKALPILALLAAAPAWCQESSLLVSDLLKQIQRGINIASATIDSQYRNVPALDSVTLQLQTETQLTSTAGVNLWFVRIGKEDGKTSSSQMTVVLKPAVPTKAGVPKPTLDDTIALALIGAAKGVYDAQTPPNAIPLVLDSLTAEFTFTVNKKGKTGVEFNLLPFGGSADVGGSKSATHKITVKFANKPQAKVTK